MLVLLSPSKRQNFEADPPAKVHSEPAFLGKSQTLVKELRKLSVQEISALMGVSEKIAALNKQRYKDFKTPFTLKNAKQAAFAFKGDVYDGLKAETFDDATLSYAQGHIRILSGLYGLLKPLDLIQPYRLEMRITLKNAKGKDLYAFWGDTLTQSLKKELEGAESRTIVNLASEEYFKAVQPEGLGAALVVPQFKEKKGGAYRMIGLLAKKARGRMARYIVEQRVEDPEALQFFAEDGYRFNVALSTPNSPVYTRG
jgi:cytoplasmic iron level regulating protein YaaA (DUF328/UPF0246 family)